MATFATDYWASTTTWTADTPQAINPNATATPEGLAPILLDIIGGYCQELFEILARSNPAELAAIIRENRAPDTRLTYAAEILGREVRTASTATLLRRLLANHPSPLVREGAVLGLSYQTERVEVVPALRHAAESDPSPGVRRAAGEALDQD